MTTAGTVLLYRCCVAVRVYDRTRRQDRLHGRLKFVVGDDTEGAQRSHHSSTVVRINEREASTHDLEKRLRSYSPLEALAESPTTRRRHLVEGPPHSPLFRGATTVHQAQRHHTHQLHQQASSGAVQRGTASDSMLARCRVLGRTRSARTTCR